MSDDDERIWERQPEDTPKSFEAFCIYRDMGAERTLLKVGTEIGHSTDSWTRKWSSKYNWVRRCQAWDKHQDQLRLASMEESIQEAQKKITDRLLDLVEAAIEGGISGKVSNPQVAILRDLLDRAGLEVVQKLEVTHDANDDVLDVLDTLLGRSHDKDS